MRGAMLALSGACLAFGLAPIVFWPAIARAIGAWHPAWSGLPMPAPLLRLGAIHVTLALSATIGGWWLWRKVWRQNLQRGVTWDCGYVAPTARMQYTAGSFASIITEWFAFILCPERHEHRSEAVFPANASFSEHTPETVLERIVEPASGLVLRASRLARHLQHGRVQFYVLYVLLGLVVLATWVFTGDPP
jgi:hydrogenase-4 component B